MVQKVHKKSKSQKKNEASTIHSKVVKEFLNEEGLEPDLDKTEMDTDDEELELEELVFGSNRKKNLHTSLHTESKNEKKLDVESNDDLGFFIDTKMEGEEDDGMITETVDPTLPAWEDDDELVVNINDKARLRKLKKDFNESVVSGKEYEERLRTQYEKMNPTPSWAKVTEGQQDMLFQTTQPLISTKRPIVNPEKFDIIRMKNANQQAYSQCVIQAIGFHPTAPVMFTAGLDKTLRLFQIDGKENPKIQNFFIKDMPIYSANFSSTGSQVILTGRRTVFYTLDLESGEMLKINQIRGRTEKSYERSYVSPCNKYIAILGRDGYIILLSMKTKQWVANLKMNVPVVAIAFSSKNQLWSLGSEGSVYQWNLDTKQCLHRFADEGCVKATTIAVSNSDEFIAIGSQSGVVNVYEMDTVLKSDFPAPIKAIMNLTTAITTLVFHPSSDILAIASNELKDSLRLFHLSTKRIVLNWPTSNTPLGYVSTVAFSHDGRFFGIGNDKGKVLLYRLEAYV
ncbi:WD40-repeat-containing domain protein [Globomyces pollinis-pini]|nr:WD40-repeat-containing domain protein [Globomyces pollinis-pini]